MRRARSALAISAPVVPPWDQYTTPLAAFHAGRLSASEMANILVLPADHQGRVLRRALGCPEADPPSEPVAAPAASATSKPRRKRSEALAARTVAPARAPATAKELQAASDEILANLDGGWNPIQPVNEPQTLSTRDRQGVMPEEDAFGLERANTPPRGGDPAVPPWERGMNPEQAAVIAHVYGPLRVPAKAGTGKTRALVNRIARLVRVEQVPGNRIAAFTFSKKAAGEMNKRLDQDLGITSCRVGTWHSLAMQVIKEDRLTQSQWRVDEKDRHKFMVKEAGGYKHVDWKGMDLTKVLSFIGWCKAHLWSFDSEEAAQHAASKFGAPHVRKALAVYQISDELTHGAGLLTFDDMLVFVAQHLSINENAESWAAKWDFVLCDEDQDSNIVQKVIRRALASIHGNLMVVGDKDQSIYGFRGCSPEHFINFEQEWPGARTVLLNRNYRSGRAIIDAANNVIRPAGGGEDMLAERGTDGKIGVLASASLEDEASAFVSWVQGHVAEGSPLGSCTALFRTNAQSRALEEKLLSARIPYVIIGGHSFYERREIKDVLAYLRVAMNRDEDGEAVKRCINAPFRFLGARFVDKVMDIAGSTKSKYWPSIVEEAGRLAGIQRRQQSSANEWCDIINHIQRCVLGVCADITKSDGRPATILNELVRTTHFIEWLEKEEGEESIESSHGANVRELIRVAERFDTCAELLDYIDKTISEQMKQRKNNEEGDGRVTLMSIHRSKGAEWPHVWVVGLCDGVLPHARGNMAEERRLVYVAITRGRDEVVLSWVRYMALKGGVKPMQPSPFLFDAGLGSGLLEADVGEPATTDPNMNAAHGPTLRKTDAIEEEQVELLDEKGIDNRIADIQVIAGQLGSLLDD